MIPQEGIETEEYYFNEEDFKDWLKAVKIRLEAQIWEAQIRKELPEKRWQELTAYILLQRPAQTVAQELVSEIPDSLIAELRDLPLENLPDELSRRLTDYLFSSLARTMTDWLEKRMWKTAKPPGPRLEHTPDEMALHLARIMADKASDGIFCAPDVLLSITMPSCKGGSGRRYFKPHSSASCGFSTDHPSLFLLLGRANAVRFRIAGMAAVMLYNKIREGKATNENCVSGQIKAMGSN